MHQAPGIVSAALQVLATILVSAGGLRFAILMKGCLMLRRQARGHNRDDRAILLKSPLVPAVSAVAVARDFSPETRRFVRRLLTLHFGEHEVVLVLAGLNEAERKGWSEELRLEPSDRDLLPGVQAIYRSREPLKIVVAEIDNADRPGALNAAVNLASGPVIALLDPASDFTPDCLLGLIHPMLHDPDGTTAVVGIGPAPEGVGVEAVELLRNWLGRCAAFAAWEMLVPISGAAVLLRRDTILTAGGFHDGPLELFLRLHGAARLKGKKFRVGFVPSEAWLPPAAAAVARQRIMREQGEIARAMAHRRRIPNGLGALGWGLPALIASRLFCPVAETAAFLLAAVGLAMRWSPMNLLWLTLLATLGTGMLVSMEAVVLRELASFRGSDPSQLSRLFFAAIPENLGYRQLRNLWLIGGWFRRA
jgi:hypothetical protein